MSKISALALALGLFAASSASAQDALFVAPPGNVGLGTSTPSSKLHVNGGDIGVSGGSFVDDGVTLNAPDHVFNPAHALTPLNP